MRLLRIQSTEYRIKKGFLFCTLLFTFYFLLFTFYSEQALAKDTLKIPKDTLKIKLSRDTGIKLEKYEILPDKQIFKIKGEKDVALEEILKKKVYTKGVAAGEFGGEKKEKIALQKVDIERKVQKPIALLKELPEKLQRQIKKEKGEVAEEEEIEESRFGGIELKKPEPSRLGGTEIITEPTLVSPIILASQEISIKTSAIKALGETKEQSAIPILKEIVTKTPTLRHDVATALAKLGDTMGIEILKRELKAEELTVKVKAIQSLGEIKETSAIPELQALLGEEETPVGTEAAFALAKAGDAKGIDRVKTLLQSKDEELKFKSAIILAGIKDKSAVPVLEAFLKSPKSSIKAQVASALGELGDKSMIPVLEELMTKDPDFRVRLSASESILKLKGITE